MVLEEEVALTPFLSRDPWLLEQLLDTAPVGLALIDRDLRFVRVNRVLAQINGVSAADHVGRSVPELLPGLPPEVLEVIARVAGGGDPVLDYEFSGDTPTHPGVIRHWRESFYPVREPDGRCIGANVVVIEVTAEVARRHLMEVLRELATVLSAADTAEAVVGAVLRLAGPAVRAERAAVHLVSGDGRTLETAGSTGGRAGSGAPVPGEPVPEAGMERPQPGVARPEAAPVELADADAVTALGAELELLPSRAAFAARHPTLARLPPLEGAVAIAGLPAERGPLGAIVLGWAGDRDLDPDEAWFLRSVGRLAGQALDRVALQAEQRHALHQATSLARILAAVAAEGDPARIARVILEEAIPAADAQFGTVRLLDDERRLAHVIAQVGYEDLDPRWLEPVPAASDTPVAEALREHRPVVVPSLHAPSRGYEALRALDAGRGPEALAVVPIATGDGTIGTIALGFRDARRFDDLELAFVRAIAEAAASALARATAEQTRAAAERTRLESERRARERADALTRTMSAVAAEADPERIAEALLREAMPAAGARFGLVRVPDGEGGTAVLFERGWDEALPRDMRPLRLDARAPTTDAMRTGLPVIVRDLGELADRYPSYVPVYERVGQQACAVFPMRTGSRNIGALLLGFEAPLVLDEADAAYIGAIAETAAAALERARLGEEERRSRAFLAGALDQLPAGVIVVDADLRLTFQNSAARELLGGGLDEGPVTDAGGPASGRRGTPIVPEDWPVVRAVRTGETIIGAEAVLSRLGDGRERVLSISAGPVADERGRIIGAVGVAHDVTEARRTAEARDAFMGVLSHELRTPLTSIYGGSQVLVRHLDELPRSVAPVAEDVASESLRMLRLVEDLLVIARVERGTLVGDREPVLIHHLVRRIVDLQRHQWPGLAIEVDIAERVPMILADEGQVEAVIRNLLGNAAKYGNGTAYVAVRPDGPVVELAVEDDGPGLLLPPERLFQLFERGREAERRATGSGIGLFVSRALVEAMGGTIVAENGRRGARFRVRFPAAPAD